MRYRTIVADPPWPIVGVGAPIRNRPPYPLMQIEEIERLGIQELALADSHLYLWTTQQFLCDAKRIARCWGYTPQNLLIWDKGGLGMGARFRPNCEFVWFCEKGYERLPIQRRDLGTVFRWPRGEHSQKPDAFFDLIQTVSPGPYLELFARAQRLGWDTWGNEALEHVELSA